MLSAPLSMLISAIALASKPLSKLGNSEGGQPGSLAPQPVSELGSESGQPISHHPTSYPYLPGQKFPGDFKWMVGTAAYQIEGAYNEDGRGASIWDTFTGANTVGMPGSVCTKAPCSVNSVQGIRGATGNVANNHYHLYEQDCAILGQLGLNTYRFSLAWPRLFPTGDAREGANPKGVQFYHNLLDCLKEHNIEPIVTLFHWDLPQVINGAR